MRFPKRADLDNELSREYVGDGLNVRIKLPVAIYHDPEDIDKELILDASGQLFLVPKIGGRTPVICQITSLPGTDEPLS